MKNLALTVIASLMLFSCSKHNEHDFIVSGTLMENCKTKTPVGGVVVSYDMNGISYATATTNADGIFELNGTVKEDYDKENTPHLVISSYNQPGSTGGVSYRKLARLPFEGAELDTIYEEIHYTVLIKLEPPSNIAGDTLFLYYLSPDGSTDDLKTNSYGVLYQRKYAAPFAGITDTISIEGEPSPLYRAEGAPLLTYWTDGNSREDFTLPIKPEEQLNSSTMNLCEDIIPATLTFE